MARVSTHAAAMQVGFFADAGPLQLFVSNHLVPEDFSYDGANEPAFVSSDEAVRVQAGAEVRLRIVGTRVDADEIVRNSPHPWLWRSSSSRESSGGLTYRAWDCTSSMWMCVTVYGIQACPQPWVAGRHVNPVLLDYMSFSQKVLLLGSQQYVGACLTDVDDAAACVTMACCGCLYGSH